MFSSITILHGNFILIINVQNLSQSVILLKSKCDLAGSHLYFALFHSVTQYGIQVLGSTSHLRRIFFNKNIN